MNDSFEDEGRLLFAKIYFKEIRVKELGDWIEFGFTLYPNKMKKVLSSEELIMDLDVLVPQLLALLKVLRIKHPKSKEEICQLFMSDIAYRQLEGKMEILTALQRMLKVLKETEDKKLHERFLNLFVKMEIVNANYAIKSLGYLGKKEMENRLRRPFLAYLEEVEKSKSRKKFRDLETGKLVIIKHLKNEKLSRLDYLIIADIFKRRKVTAHSEKQRLEGIKWYRNKHGEDFY